MTISRAVLPSQRGRIAHSSEPRELAGALLVAAARFTRLAASEAPSSIPRALWRALAQLEDMGPMRVTDLAAADRVSQPTATTLVQKLVQRGWVERSTDPKDARAVLVTMTDAGRAVLAQTRETAAEALVPRVERLDAETREALAAGIDALCDLLEADGPAGERGQLLVEVAAHP